MDTTLKYKLIEKIIQSDDEALLNSVKAVLGISDTDYWQELQSGLKNEINNAKAELDAGLGIPHNRVVDDIEAFLKQ